MTKKYYNPSKVAFSLPTVPAPTPKARTAPCDRVRFVLNSGQHLELDLDTIEEVVEDLMGGPCICICGEQVNGSKTIIPWNNISYLEDASCS